MFLLDCTLSSGAVFHWSTHEVTFGGTQYDARLLRHSSFDLRSSSDDGIDTISTLSVVFANADSQLSAIEQGVGWKGAQLSVQFVFFNLPSGTAVSESRVLFRGIANSPDSSTESELQVSFTNRLNLHRTFLPEIRVQRRCPWAFPTTSAQLTEAVNGGARGKFSPFYRCGYSAGQTGGVGSLNGTLPYSSCDFTRTQCQQRGMFSKDSGGNTTARFGGVEFVPASVLVRGYGQKSLQVSALIDNQARYNDFVPLTYGAGWYQPPIVFARNDGNLTRMEVLLSAGQIQGVVKIVVNGIEIPAGRAGANMTATGWYNVVTAGARSGGFNLDFTDSAGNPLGDPYGSMAFASVVVPNRISNGQSLARVDVLIQGMQLSQYDASGNYLGDSFTNNPAWVLLDVLNRSGWHNTDIDLPTFAAVAARCAAPVPVVDVNGNTSLVPRNQCNLILSDRRSAADVVRGIRNASGLSIILGTAGLLQLRADDTLALQQPALPDGSNATSTLNGGWPAYEFSDGNVSGIARKPNGQSSVVVSTRSGADVPNRLTVEFQDQFNEYQQDSLSLVDIPDVLLSGQEVTASLTALGLPNYAQAGAAITLQLNRIVNGNTYVVFDTSVKSVSLTPGEIITLTYAREGWARQPFRILRIAPGANYRTATITAQIHDDAWYVPGATVSATGARQAAYELTIPRPLVGAALDTSGNEQFSVVETDVQSADGSFQVNLAVGFTPPGKPGATGASIPLVGLNAIYASTGGTLHGGQVYYYGLSAVDATGAESAVSFLIPANIPTGTNTNKVTLQNLSFSQTTVSFDVYRGTTPAQLLRLASGVPVAAAFTETGFTPTLLGPPDRNFDHANFYWRFELQPPTPVTIESATTVGNSTLGMLVNEFNGSTVRISAGTGAGQERGILSNTATTLTIAKQWDIVPDATSLFLVADSAWHFGSTGSNTPISFEVPNQQGTTVHISGRAANVKNEECAYELSPLTSWQIGGSVGSQLDSDIPPTPTFGLFPTGQGSVALQAIGFGTLTNTRTIAAGTLTLGYWNELSSPTLYNLAAAIGVSDTTITLNIAAGAQVNDLIQIDSEIFQVVAILNGGLGFTVTRAAYGSTAVAHTALTPVYPLTKTTFILPFVRDFFGSLASGSYSYPVYLPDTRIATASLFMTNLKGGSAVTRLAFTGTTDRGLRTLSGGQLSIQVAGQLAIQNNAAPLLVSENTHSVRDIFAVVKVAPNFGPVTMNLNQNGALYCTLTIPVGATISNVVNGFTLPPLQTQANITLDITSVSQTSSTLPGSDLTVVIRL